jgi:hypothetical protein
MKTSTLYILVMIACMTAMSLVHFMMIGDAEVVHYIKMGLAALLPIGAYIILTKV